MATTTRLERGMLLRDVAATTLDGRAVHASDFRGRRNIVLLFPGSHGEESELLLDLRRHDEQLREEEAAVLIAHDVSVDVALIYGAVGPGGSRIAALYITDRYGEIYFASQGGEPLPPVAEMLEWLRFINAQCPE